MRLYTKDLVKRYKTRTVVDHVSIEVNQGEIVGLLGPNGAGKTTTFYMIVGLIKPNEGSIFLEDQELTNEPVYKRAQKGVGYLAQEASVFRRLSVEDNIRAVLQMTNFTKEYQKERLENLIEEFRLTKVRKSLGIQLSGGERRRTEIARAVEAAGADAVSLINTIRGMRIDVNTRRPILKMNTGGMSGPAVLPVAVRMVWEVSQAVKIPILGMGGVSRGEDAAQLMLAGATAVAVGTAMFADPFAPLKVRDELSHIAAKQGLEHVAQLTGGVKPW